MARRTIWLIAVLAAIWAGAGARAQGLVSVELENDAQYRLSAKLEGYLASGHVLRPTVPHYGLANGRYVFGTEQFAAEFPTGVEKAGQPAAGRNVISLRANISLAHALMFRKFQFNDVPVALALIPEINSYTGSAARYVRDVAPVKEWVQQSREELPPDMVLLPLREPVVPDEACHKRRRFELDLTAYIPERGVQTTSSLAKLSKALLAQSPKCSARLGGRSLASELAAATRKLPLRDTPVLYSPHQHSGNATGRVLLLRTRYQVHLLLWSPSRKAFHMTTELDVRWKHVVPQSGMRITVRSPVRLVDIGKLLVSLVPAAETDLPKTDHDECPICFDSLRSNLGEFDGETAGERLMRGRVGSDLLRTHCCNHHFHDHCLSRTFSTRRAVDSCPICRSLLVEPAAE